MLVSGDFERIEPEPARAPIDGFDRLCLAVLAAFPLAAAARLVADLLG